MDILDFENITPEAFRQYQGDNEEQDYLLVDVRQPDEYRLEHIPGSKLIPLDELEANLGLLPTGKDLFFYCRSGARSQAAAIISLDSGIKLQKVYNLIGGMLGWDGQSMVDLPRVSVFQEDASLSELMLTAMSLEKAALRFYETVYERHAQTSYADIIKTLSLAEEAHAKSIYSHWKKTQDNPLSFEKLFASLDGEILEGGEQLMEVIERLDTLGDLGCLSLMEFAMSIEIQAYDLYRHVANSLEEVAGQDAFLFIAQMEKTHMTLLAKVFKQCSN